MSQLTLAECEPLKLLLKSTSKAIVEKVYMQVFKHMHGTLEQAETIETSLEQAFGITAAEAAALHVAVRHTISASLLTFTGAGDGTITSEQLFPSGFHEQLGALLCKIISTHRVEWRQSAIVRQPSLPRLLDVDWRVDVKTASDTASQMSVPTVLLRMTLAGVDGAPQPVLMELSRDSLQTLLESMAKIRSQLQSITTQTSS
jgi:hypothetical protein